LADLYAIIKTMEALEKALLRDCIKQDECGMDQQHRAQPDNTHTLKDTSKTVQSC
jgi:hypothetical protein